MRLTSSYFPSESHAMIRYTREKGRAIIAEIRVRNGGISAEDRRNTPATVLESFDNRGRQLGKQLIGYRPK